MVYFDLYLESICTCFENNISILIILLCRAFFCVIDQNNISHVLINNARTAWPNKMLIYFETSSSECLLWFSKQ